MNDNRDDMVDGYDELIADMEALIARYYDERTWRVGRWYLKMGWLTLYVYSHGMGWTWMCGKGHEVIWWPL
jgi:hypothetical protein